MLRTVVVALLVAVAAVRAGSVSAVSAESATIQGDFVGTLGPLRLKLHIRVAASGRRQAATVALRFSIRRTTMPASFC
jgi:hypothetical protein